MTFDWRGILLAQRNFLFQLTKHLLPKVEWALEFIFILILQSGLLMQKSSTRHHALHPESIFARWISFLLWIKPGCHQTLSCAWWGIHKLLLHACHHWCCRDCHLLCALRSCLSKILFPLNYPIAMISERRPLNLCAPRVCLIIICLLIHVLQLILCPLCIRFINVALIVVDDFLF